MTQPLIERYRSVLPVSDSTPVISLGEGSTPLLPAPRLSESYGVELWLKWEGANPTGSYKDRGMTVAVGQLELVPEVERNRRTIEPGAEVRRRRGGTHDHRAASAIASGSAATWLTGCARRSALATSLRP